jgi:hypothetical protein
VKDSRSLRYAGGVVLAAALLAGCSAGSGFSPSAPAMQQNAASSHTQTVGMATTRNLGGATPDEQDPCSGLNVQVYGPATWWTESLGPPITWTETTGYYVEETTDGGIIFSPCPGSTSYTCSPSPTCPGSTYYFHVQVEPAIAFRPSKCTSCYVVAEASQSQIAVVSASAKKTSVKQVATLSTTLGSVSYAPIGVAVAKDGTIYASVVSVVGSGFGNSCILVYPPGSSSPSSMLSDPGLGQAAGTIAVDKKGDVFLAYTATNSGEISAQIDEFPAGHTTWVPFASMSNAYDGGLAITKKGDVIASSVSLSGTGGGEIAAFSPKGKAVYSFDVSGLPTAISLDKSDKHLYVDDATSDLISEYSLPNGSLVVSGPAETAKGGPLVPANFLP